MREGIPKTLSLRGCLDPFFSSLNFRHSIFIIYHSSLITLKYQGCLAPSLTYHHSIFFTLFVGHKLVTWCSFFFPPSTQKLEPSERRKGKKKKKNLRRRLNPVKEKREKKQKKLRRRSNPVKEERKKKKKKEKEIQEEKTEPRRRK